MSRMILACCALVFAAGCCNQCRAIPHHASLAKASIESHGPSGIIFAGEHGDCSDTIPHRPWTDQYEPWWDYHITRYAAELSGYRAYREYSDECGKPLSCHFKCGFITAFEDLALNKRPSPPIVPPPKYWNAYYRSCAGRPCVDDWFAGYEAGLSVGCNSGVSQFGEIYLRRDGCQSGPGGWNQGQSYDQRHSAPQQRYPSQQSAAPGLQQTPQPVAQPATVLPRDMPNPYAPAG